MAFQLHRTRYKQLYLVGDTDLTIVYSDSVGAWVLLGPTHGWAERNKEMMGARFATLREAREALEAVFSLDPPEDALQGYETVQIKRLDNGQYLVDLQEGRQFLAQRSGDGDLQAVVGGTTTSVRSLWALRRSAQQRLRRNEAIRFRGRSMVSER